MATWKIFYSYSQKDEELRQKLAAHLAPLEHRSLLESWHDREIPVGGEWDKVIHAKLESADLIVASHQFGFPGEQLLFRN
jgi:hypothetical protein